MLSDDPEGNGGAARRLPRCARVTGMGHFTLGRARVHQKEASCKMKLGLQLLARPCLEPRRPPKPVLPPVPSPHKVRIASSTNLVRPVPSSTFSWHLLRSPSCCICIFLQLRVHLALCCQLPQVTITHRASKTPSESLESLFSRVGFTPFLLYPAVSNFVPEPPPVDQPPPIHNPDPLRSLNGHATAIRRFAVRFCARHNNHVR